MASDRRGPPASLVLHAAPLSLCVALALSVALLAYTGSARASAPSATNQARLESTVRYLQDVQGADGGFGTAEAEQSQDFSAWVALALAAAGVNPQDQARPGGVDVYSFLVAHASQALPDELCKPVICTTSLERELLVVDAAGASPHDFAGFDLVGQILARELPDGSFPFVPGGHGEVNDTVFAILALSLVTEPTAQAAVQHAAAWLIGQQNGDGSWSPLHPRIEAGEVDMTGAAIDALNAADPHATEAADRQAAGAQQRAFEYLLKAQEPSGGFPERPGESEANVASTAWAVQGIWSAGQSPETWIASSGQEPLSYMASLQQPDGHIRWKQGEEMNGVWMTAYVAPAFAGRPLPIAAVPRATPSTSTAPALNSTSPPASGTAEPGQGGESSRPDSGVIAGGGGNGSPLFARPRPQSQGHTPGGVRLLGSTREQATGKSAAGRPHLAGGDPTTRGPHAERPRATARTRLTQGSGGTPERNGGAPAGGREVKGLLIGAPAGRHSLDAPAAGAPGLHGAGSGGNRAPWLALGIGGAIMLIALGGSQLERRRPQVIL